MPEFAAMPQITVLYAGLLGLMAVVLSVLVGRYRTPSAEGRVSIGDGGRPEVLVAMRRHANFVEYVPLMLILIALLELNDVDGTVIHVMGATLVGVRASHAWGMQPDDARGIFRFIGAVGTTLLLVVTSIWAIAVF